MSKNELINKAIESAKCRTYKVMFDLNGGKRSHHQKKAENQKELMEVTVDALERLLPVKPIRHSYTVEMTGRRHSMTYCGHCGDYHQRVVRGDKYCRKCGTAIDWSEDDA